MIRDVLQRAFIMLGVFTCGINVVVALTAGEDIRACAIALLGLVLVHAAVAIGEIDP